MMVGAKYCGIRTQERGRGDYASQKDGYCVGEILYVCNILATETTNVSSLPPNQGLRVIYAVALENAQQNNRKELEILSAMGIDFDPRLTGLRLRNGAAVGDEGDQGLALDCSAQLPLQTPLKEVSITVAHGAH